MSSAATHASKQLHVDAPAPRVSKLAAAAFSFAVMPTLAIGLLAWVESGGGAIVRSGIHSRYHDGAAFLAASALAGLVGLVLAVVAATRLRRATVDDGPRGRRLALAAIPLALLGSLVAAFVAWVAVYA